MRRWLLCAWLVALATETPEMVAKDGRTIKTMYCVPGARGEWVLQRFKPLINVRGRTVFAEMSVAGGGLHELRMRRFYPDAEVVFDYKFDASGKLDALLGTVKVFGQWVADANLTPESDGSMSATQVRYTLNGDRVPKPENARDYLGRLDEAVIYRTVQGVPCSERLKEAERLNAAQG